MSTWRDAEEESWAPFDAALREVRQEAPDPELRGRCLPPDAGGERGTRILVVDDEPNIRRLIEHHLLRHGYGVELCANGAEALECIGRRRPDLIVLDVMMPGMDGFEVLARLKEDPATVEIPVLMLTARGTDDDIRNGWGIGAEWYMTKPFNPEELCFLLARMAAILDSPDSPPPLRRFLK
ncbi:MAG: response regulator [Armatimonadetes bacterium]|nr:response regulator [Armatimonadota bacterium]